MSVHHPESEDPSTWGPVGFLLSPVGANNLSRTDCCTEGNPTMQHEDSPPGLEPDTHPCVGVENVGSQPVADLLPHGSQFIILSYPLAGDEDSGL